MSNPLLLYSTNSWLAYKISKEYYSDRHYVWCSPHFSFKRGPSFEYTNPPSSSPGEIYERLYQDVMTGDLHSAKIEANRIGIQNGAVKKAQAKEISNRTKTTILSIAKQAQVQYFRPLLYVIPFVGVADLVKEVPVDRRANLFSDEYVIERLPRHLFDIIEYKAS